MRENDITLNKVESWVREKSPFELPETKYPVIYGVYGDPRTEIDERKIDFHKQYWKLNASDLAIAENTLSKKLEALSHKIYESAGYMLVYAKQEFPEVKYSKFKDRVLNWILAVSKIGDKAKGMAIGMAIINKIDSAKWDISRSSHSLLFQSIAQANTVRENWIYTCEKIEVVKKFIQAKANNVPAYYAPGYADRLLLVTNEHGKRDYAIESLWDSKEYDLLLNRETLRKVNIVDKGLSLKEDGMKDMPLFKLMKKWLLDDLKFTNEELESRFGFYFHDHEDGYKTFNRFLNNRKNKRNKTK